MRIEAGQTYQDLMLPASTYRHKAAEQKGTFRDDAPEREPQSLTVGGPGMGVGLKRSSG